MLLSLSLFWLPIHKYRQFPLLILFLQITVFSVRKFTPADFVVYFILESHMVDRAGWYWTVLDKDTTFNLYGDWVTSSLLISLLPLDNRNHTGITLTLKKCPFASVSRLTPPPLQCTSYTGKMDLT